MDIKQEVESSEDENGDVSDNIVQINKYEVKIEYTNEPESSAIENSETNEDNIGIQNVASQKTLPHPTTEVNTSSGLDKFNMDEDMGLNIKCQKFKCNVCNKIFNRTNDLIKHVRIHTGERPYKCEVCKKTFTQSSTLQGHRRTHSGERPFVCEVCNKTFTESSTLTKHRRIHTGERPFKCNKCDKGFIGSNNLSRHLKTHIDLKSLECDICFKTFVAKASLTKHKKIHYGIPVRRRAT